MPNPRSWLRSPKDNILHEEAPADDSMRAHTPEISDLCPYCKPIRERNRNISLLFTSLKEFGYSTLTRDEVATAYDGALAGEDTGGDIIRKLVRSQMVEAGLIKEDSDAG